MVRREDASARSFTRQVGGAGRFVTRRDRLAPLVQLVGPLALVELGVDHHPRSLGRRSSHGNPMNTPTWTTALLWSSDERVTGGGLSLATRGRAPRTLVRRFVAAPEPRDARDPRGARLSWAVAGDLCCRRSGPRNVPNLRLARALLPREVGPPSDRWTATDGHRLRRPRDSANLGHLRVVEVARAAFLSCDRPVGAGWMRPPEACWWPGSSMNRGTRKAVETSETVRRMRHFCLWALG